MHFQMEQPGTFNLKCANPEIGLKFYPLSNNDWVTDIHRAILNLKAKVKNPIESFSKALRTAMKDRYGSYATVMYKRHGVWSVVIDDYESCISPNATTTGMFDVCLNDVLSFKLIPEFAPAKTFQLVSANWKNDVIQAFK